jgi:hypothetical protein
MEVRFCWDSIFWVWFLYNLQVFLFILEPFNLPFWFSEILHLVFPRIFHLISAIMNINTSHSLRFCNYSTNFTKWLCLAIFLLDSSILFILVRKFYCRCLIDWTLNWFCWYVCYFIVFIIISLFFMNIFPLF